MEYLQEAMAHHEADADELSQQKCKSVSTPATASENDNDCFNCNICLENAHDPIVTLCGHLYCWPCIYKWLHFQSASPAVDHEPQCPVCKAEVSISTLVPLYGRGQSSTQTEREVKGPFPGLEIPCRPSACGVNALITTTTTAGTSRPNHRHHPNMYQPQLQQDHQPYYYTATPRRGGSIQPMFNLGGTTTMSVFYPMVEMLGEMMYARAAMGNNTQSSMLRYRNSYYQSGNISPRVRRQEMQADKSLNRISIFLFCCLVLCLFSF